jgi:PPOX class probable F420-dependent enzyme
MKITIPDSHLNLVTEPIHGVLTTMMPDDQPQSSLVWVGFNGEYAYVNTTLERQKGKNVLRNPKVNLLIIDPKDTTRYIEIRGEAELVKDGALENIDEVTRQYTNHPQYYGYVFPKEQKGKETRVILLIKPSRVNLDAIHR